MELPKSRTVPQSQTGSSGHPGGCKVLPALKALRLSSLLPTIQTLAFSWGWRSALLGSSRRGLRLRADPGRGGGKEGSHSPRTRRKASRQASLNSRISASLQGGGGD